MMLPKPYGCRGCPFYQDGKGFVPDRINDQAQVLFVAQNPGADEEAGRRYKGTVSGFDQYEPTEPQPLIGKTGAALDRFLEVAGLTRDDISTGNALRCRYHGRDKLPPLASASVREAMEHCFKAHFRMPQGTKLIVASGDYALYALTQHGMSKNDKIGDWRGYVLPFTPIGSPQVTQSEIWHPSHGPQPTVLATYHLAYTFRDPVAELICMRDFIKIPKVLRGEWPTKLPLVLDTPPQRWPERVAFDTEFVPTSKHFLMYSMYDGNKLRVVNKLDAGIVTNDTPYWVVMHNAPADLLYLRQLLPMFTYDDTMHSHAVLWSDFPHDLGFLGSIYASINRWKHLMHLNERVYSAADAFATWEAWFAIEKEFKRDPQSWHVYADIQRKLIPIIQHSNAVGVRVNQQRVAEHYEKRKTIIDSLQRQAEAVVGWPINLRSNLQVSYQLYNVEGLMKLVKK